MKPSKIDQAYELIFPTPKPSTFPKIRRTMNFQDFISSPRSAYARLKKIGEIEKS